MGTGLRLEIILSERLSPSQSTNGQPQKDKRSESGETDGKRHSGNRLPPERVAVLQRYLFYVLAQARRGSILDAERLSLFEWAIYQAKRKQRL